MGLVCSVYTFTHDIIRTKIIVVNYSVLLVFKIMNFRLE